MYAIHTTPGFIIGSRPYGEAGKMLSIFTRDFGLVTATAQGIRLERSKLRYHAQDYSFGSFSLVRGKEFWRLTSAVSDPRLLYYGIADAGLIVRLASLLRRLLQGEEANPALFECIESCARAIREKPNLREKELMTLESFTVLSILHALGYVAEAPQAGMPREEMNRLINRALQESHL